jgi:hypothetical protein
MAINAGIGLISTIKYINTNLRSNFERGVGNAGWAAAATPVPSLGYDDRNLHPAVDAANANNNVGLIVTVGGVASARAALLWTK